MNPLDNNAASAASSAAAMLGQAQGVNQNLAQLVANIKQAIGVSVSLALPGFIVFGNGLILQWGTGSTTTGAGTITYPKAFTTKVFVVMLTVTGTGTNADNALIASTTPGLTTCSVFGNSGQSLTFTYFAVGY